MTLEDIYNKITERFISDPVVIAKYELEEGKTFNEQFSEASLERILFYDIASNMLLNMQNFNQHKIDVDKLLGEKKAHTPNWYASMAKLFQFGYELAGDSDAYDNSGLTQEEIDKSRIVKFAAAVSGRDKSILYLKIATGTNENKQPLSNTQLEAFTFYMSQISDAGVNLIIINDPADEIAIEMDVYYDPLILDKYGKRLDGSDDTPVQNAIKYYIHNLQFNGMYVNASLVDSVQAVTGVKFPELKGAASRYGVYTEFRKIDGRERAHAGYYTIKDTNLKLNFKPYDE